MKSLSEDGRSQRGKLFFASIFLLAIFGLMTRANGQQPCVITNDAETFTIVLIGQDINSWVTITWQSCTDHVYVVLSTDSLDTNTAWTPVAWMRGADQQTAWTDQSAAGVAQRFYKIERLTELGDEDGDGIPNGWEVDNGLNPLDPGDAAQDADGDGVDNLTEYLQGRDPTKGAVADIGGLVNLNVFTPLE